jgi:hypothetical protein
VTAHSASEDVARLRPCGAGCRTLVSDIGRPQHSVSRDTDADALAELPSPEENRPHVRCDADGSRSDSRSVSAVDIALIPVEQPHAASMYSSATDGPWTLTAKASSFQHHLGPRRLPVVRCETRQATGKRPRREATKDVVSQMGWVGGSSFAVLELCYLAKSGLPTKWSFMMPIS